MMHNAAASWAASRQRPVSGAAAQHLSPRPARLALFPSSLAEQCHHTSLPLTMARLAASVALLAALALAAAPPAAARPLEAFLGRQRCPPPGFDALQDFNVTQ